MMKLEFSFDPQTNACMDFVRATLTINKTGYFSCNCLFINTRLDIQCYGEYRFYMNIAGTPRNLFAVDGTSAYIDKIRQSYEPVDNKYDARFIDVWDKLSNGTIVPKFVTNGEDKP